MLSTLPIITTIVNTQSYPTQMRTSSIFFLLQLQSLSTIWLQEWTAAQYSNKNHTPCHPIKWKFLNLNSHTFFSSRRMRDWWLSGGAGSLYPLQYTISHSYLIAAKISPVPHGVNQKCNQKNLCPMGSLFSSTDTKIKFKQDNISTEHTI